MKTVLAVAALGLVIWGALALIGKKSKTGSDYAPVAGVTAEKPGDRAFKNAALRELEASIADWPQGSRRVAHRMIEKYGMPDEIKARRLGWNDNGPWKRTIVFRDTGHNCIEQVASYHVPNDRYDQIRKVEGSVSAERGRDELVSRAADEPLNFLALNLAEEVVSGRREPPSAREFYRHTAALAASGKGSPYTEGLLFADVTTPKP